MGDCRVGFCYAVLTSDGSCKFGRTADAFGRIYAHVVAAEGFGAKVERIYLTEQVKDCFKLERKIFEHLQSDKWKSEYLKEMTTGEIESTFNACGVSFFSGHKIHRGQRRGEIMFSQYPYTIKGNTRGPDELGTTIEEKILYYVRKMQPMRRGVLINRVRTFDPSDVSQAIDDLEERGVIAPMLIPNKRGTGSLKRLAMADFDGES